MSDNLRFGDKLAADEPVNGNLREKYEKEIENMLNKRLNGVQRFMCWATGLMSLAMASGFGWLGLTTTELPTTARVVFVVGALFALGWTAMMVHIIRKGTLHLINDENAQGGWAYGVTLVIVMGAMFMGGDHPESTVSVYMVVNATVFFIGGCMALLLAKINQSEIKSREKMLEIELRLAEISEMLQVRPQS